MNFIEAIEIGVSYADSGDFPSAEFVFLQILSQFPESKLVKHLHSQVEGALQAAENGSLAEKRIIQTFKSRQTHYASVPEYNINWALADLSPINEFLESNPIIVVDVGARDGFLGEIEDLKSYINYIGFDADTDECARINANTPPGFNNFRVLPHFIGSGDEAHEFYIYNSPGDSSRFTPCQSFTRKFNPRFGIAKAVNVRPISLSSALQQEGIDQVDFLKLDTQGSELEILKSAKHNLDGLLLIESEVEITQMYEGQPLIGEFLNFMNTNGFEVLYINRVFQNRYNYLGPAKGQVTFCDVLFARKSEFYEKFDAVQVAKHAILLCNYGHLDIASEIWNGRSDVRTLIPQLAAYFKPFAPNSERFELMSRDKLLCWQLHKRKTNQLASDSDRSWPFR